MLILCYGWIQDTRHNTADRYFRPDLIYRILRVIGRYFFPINHWPRLIICIELLVFY